MDENNNNIIIDVEESLISITEGIKQLLIKLMGDGYRSHHIIVNDNIEDEIAGIYVMPIKKINDDYILKYKYEGSDLIIMLDDEPYVDKIFNDTQIKQVKNLIANYEGELKIYLVPVEDD